MPDEGFCLYEWQHGLYNLMIEALIKSSLKSEISGQIPSDDVGSAPPLIYDTIGSVVGAYGVRKLKNSYTGNCCRLRRNTDNAELDIGFANGRLDTSAAVSFIGGGTGFFVKWYDQSGNGYDLVQNIAAVQPVYTNSISGVAPGAYLGSGSLPANHMKVTTPSNIVTANLSAIFYINRSAYVNNGSPGLCINTTTVNDYTDPKNLLAAADTASNVITTYHNGAGSTGAHPGNLVFVSIITTFSGGSNTLYINGAAQPTVATTGTFDFNVMGIGLRYTSSAFFAGYAGYIEEFIVLSKALSAGEATLIRNDQAAYYV